MMKKTVEKNPRRFGVLLIAMLFIFGAVFFAPKAEAANKSITFKLTTLDGRTITEKTYGSRYQILVFYRSFIDEDKVCYNSAGFLQSLAPTLEQGWIQDLDVQIIMVGGDASSPPTELKKFVNKYASDVSSKYVDFVGIDEALMWKIHGNGSLTYSYCALVKDGTVVDTENAVYDAGDLINLLDGHVDTSKLYQTIQIISKYDYSAAFDILTKTNAKRASEGLPALKMDKDLLEAAMQRATELSAYYSHTRPNAKMCYTVHQKVNGENIAMGQPDAETVMTDWINSPPHLENILRPEFVTMGVGAVQVNGQMFWVQLFGCEADSSAVAKKADYTTDSLVTKYPRIQIANSYVNNGTIHQVVEPTDTVFDVGETKTIKIVYMKDPVAEWFYATPITSKMTFTSSNTAVATVSDKGVITAVSSGDSVITVRSTLSADSAPALLTLKISVEAEPAITTQPNDVAASVGSTASFTVKATGGGLQYQWFCRSSETGEWKALTGANGKRATCTLTTAAKHDGYQFFCRIENTRGTLDTNVVTLRLKPAVTVQPDNVTVSVGSTASFTVKAAGSGLQYQWYCRSSAAGEWKALTGANGKKATCTLTAAAGHDGYQFRCQVQNTLGTAYSSPVTLRVKPAITVQPVNKSVVAGKKAAFSVTAVGKDLQYQWYCRSSSTGSWSKMTSASSKTATLVLITGSGHNGYQFFCLVKNAAGSVNSRAALLTITGGAIITTQPSNTTVTEGNKATFKVAASGTGLSYQWYCRNSSSGTWTKLTSSSATTATLSIITKASHNGYQFYCAVSDAAGTVNSKAATLTVQ